VARIKEKFTKKSDQGGNVIVEKHNGQADAGEINPFWWEVDENQIHEHLFPLVQQTEARQSYRRVQNYRHASLYSNFEIRNLQLGLYNTQAARGVQNRSRVTLNVVKSCIDTVASKIAKTKPKVLFLTEGGDFKLKRKAELLTAYVEAKFEEMGLYEQKQKSFVDSGIFGTGETKFFIEDDKIKCERIIVDEVIVEDAEGIYGSPNQKHQTRLVNKELLKAVFPKFASRIQDAAGSIQGLSASQSKTSLIKVIESWRLPSSEGAKDGKHAIVIENATLFEETYEKAYFPFDTLRWADNVTGYYGMGIAEELIAIQLELNWYLEKIQTVHHYVCVPRVWVETGSGVNTSHITNDNRGAVGKYSGTPPLFNTAPGLSPEVYEHMRFLYQKAYEIVGVSQLSANSSKPAGLNSAVALREFQDVESDRFELAGQRWENSFLTDARMVIDLTKDLVKKGIDPYAKISSKSGIRLLKWSEVSMEDDQYEIKTFPISMLPSQPAGKLQTVTELTQAGFIDKDSALDLLDFPDLKAYLNRKNAPLKNIERLIELMVFEEKYESPEPYMNLDLAIDLVQESYLYYRNEGATEAGLELLQRFLADCKALQDMAAQAMQAQAMQAQAATQPPGAAPQAVPQAPPQSDILPNSPGQAA
jgi:hypothetical protein